MLINLGEDYFEEQHAKFDLVANSSLYSLPVDAVEMKQVRLAYSGTPASPSDYKIATSYDPTEVHFIPSDEENIPTSNPIVDMTGAYIRIKPTPTVNVTGGGDMSYIAMPSALVLTADVPVIPTQYQELIAVYGQKQMEFKYEKWNKHDRDEKIWDEAIAELEQTLADRDLNKPTRFKSILETGAPNNFRRRRELPGW